MKVKCQFCGNEINRKPSSVILYKIHFCNMQCRKAWSNSRWDEHLEEIKSLYEQGRTIEEVGLQFNVSPSVIQRVLVKHEIPKRYSFLCPPTDRTGRFIGTLGKFSREDLLILLRKYYEEEKLNYSEIAQRLHCSHQTVRKYLVEFSLLRSYRETMKIVHARHRKPRVKRAGYYWLYMPDYHRHSSDGYVQEHVYVWEQTHGQFLPKGWIVHHYNGIKLDNGPENLIGLESKAHKLVLAKLSERIRQLEVENQELKRSVE